MISAIGILSSFSSRAAFLQISHCSGLMRWSFFISNRVSSSRDTPAGALSPYFSSRRHFRLFQRADFVLTPCVHRESVKAAARLVVKLGTGVLTDSCRQPDPAQLEQLVAQIAALRKAGKEIVLVTSGAVGAGMGALGYEKRPHELAELQRSEERRVGKECRSLWSPN